MNRLGIPQERMAKRLGVDQKTIFNHLGKKAELPNLLKAEIPFEGEIVRWGD